MNQLRSILLAFVFVRDFFLSRCGALCPNIDGEAIFRNVRGLSSYCGRGFSQHLD